MYPYLHIGTANISTYFLLISLASTLASFWFIGRMETHHLSRLLAIDLTLVTLVSAFVGARLLHVMYEEFAFYRENPRQILEIWNGGFVFYGGLLGGTAGIYIFCLLKRIPFELAMDMAALPASFAYGVGRLACFLNGCCYGRLCELPWAMNLHGEHRHPTQIYASVGEAFTLFVMLKAEPRFRQPGQLTGLWLVLHASNRLVMEHFRDDPRGDMMLGLSLGTWLSVALICVGIGLLWPRPQPAAPELQSR